MRKIVDSNGKAVTLYNPYEKLQYYGKQLKSGKDKDGKPLNKRQKAYRAGYVKPWKDNRNAGAKKYGFPNNGKRK